MRSKPTWLTHAGERGGTTRSLEEASELIETHKGDFAAAVRADILDHLNTAATWHRDDLRVILPADSKNVLGAVVNGLVRSGRIVETGERRPSADPAGHGRKSNVYRLSQVSGQTDPERAKHDPVSIEIAGQSVSPHASSPAKEGTGTPAELTGDRDERGEGERNSDVIACGSGPLALFELEADEANGDNSYYDREAA